MAIRNELAAAAAFQEEFLERALQGINAALSSVGATVQSDCIGFSPQALPSGLVSVRTRMLRAQISVLGTSTG
jgi:hypothetical protein